MNNVKFLVPCIYCDTQPVENDIIFNKNGYNIVRCKNCQLVYVGNPPMKEMIEKLYTFESGYHNKIIDGLTNYPSIKRAKEQCKFMQEISKPVSLLDVGCSAGFFLKELKKNNWVDVHGLEISSDTASIAKHYFNLDVAVGSLQDADFKGKKFDIITLWDVVEHLENPLSSLKKAYELLNDDGIIVIETPNIDGLFPRVSKIFANLINYWPHPEPPEHLYQYSEKTISNFLNKSGFKIKNIYHQSIPLSYSFGDFKILMKSPKYFSYALAFAPLAALGPFIHSGDSIRLVAKKIANTI